MNVSTNIYQKMSIANAQKVSGRVDANPQRLEKIPFSKDQEFTLTLGEYHESYIFHKRMVQRRYLGKACVYCLKCCFIKLRYGKLKKKNHAVHKWLVKTVVTG